MIPTPSVGHHSYEMLDEILDEADRAQDRYGDFTSTHEALGVLVEELDELRSAVRANALESVRTEAIQVAAVALRLARHCRGLPAFAQRSSK